MADEPLRGLPISVCLCVHECQNRSPDGDSIYNTSEEEDYDAGLPEKEEGITCYTCYCPEDDSYLEGMGCNGDERILLWDRRGVARLGGPAPPRLLCSGQPGLPRWLTAHHGGRALCPGGPRTGRRWPHYCPSKEGYQDCYPTKANGNTGASHYHLRHGGGDMEDQEEDIDLIVAKIKRNLSVTSITSASEASMGLSPHLGTLKRPACPGRPAAAPAGTKRNRSHRTSLLRSGTMKTPQRGFKPKTRTPEERLKWPHKQMESHSVAILVQSRLTATSTSQVPAILLPQLPAE
ncbi:amyloid-beta A4 precursor protein-binding family A member 2-like [Saimiri boliviensis]|uniref:amyloid-beta A4 precursor protein-binding family A member 2-like n=1 Tax=Saimiri boliviensis TaxID=27679 RepID=UPI003D76A747